MLRVGTTAGYAFTLFRRNEIGTELFLSTINGDFSWSSRFEDAVWTIPGNKVSGVGFMIHGICWATENGYEFSVIKFPTSRLPEPGQSIVTLFP